MSRSVSGVELESKPVTCIKILVVYGGEIKHTEQYIMGMNCSKFFRRHWDGVNFI